MFLKNKDNIAKIASIAGFSIFELPRDFDQKSILNSAYRIEPNEKGNISIEQIREIQDIIRGKQAKDLIIVIEQAELMGESAANAFLKSLEEPNDKIHFVFLVTNLAQILPTIKSRAHSFYLSDEHKTTDPPAMDAKAKEEARAYISATPDQLVEIADKINKLKEGKREKALELVHNSIELVYKSYFITGNDKLLAKLEKLLKTEAALNGFGNIKLQLVANML